MLSLEKPGTPEELVDRYITTKVPLDKPGTPQELNHHGIKGMHWGIRKEQVHPSIAHIPKKTRKEAEKDAEEFTRAKLFYGEGAGTRRKLIKAKVESKKAKDPLYAKAFDHFIKRTDLGQRAAQARAQRKRKDVTKQTKRTTKKVVNILGPLLVNQRSSSFHSDLDRTRSLGLDYTSDILEHHGIKGMHWGIRKKEETSGSKSKSKPISARREKRAQGREAHASRVQAQIDRIQANPSTHRIVQAHRDRKVRELQDIRDQHLQDAKDIREHNITRGQKRVLIGAGVAAGVLATYGTYKLVDSGKAHALLNRGPLKESVHLLKKDMTPDEIMHTVVKPINPNYGELGTKMNCRRCTFAYELRRRGYDVKATKSHSGTGQTAGSLLDATDKESNVSSRLGMIRQLMKEQQSGGTDSKFTDFIATGGMGKDWSSNADFHLMTPAAKSADLFNALAQQGNKARGEVGMTWNFGGGHSMAYEVINNVPHVFDTQTGERYNLADFTEKIAPTMAKAGATRLDNVNLNGAFLEKWIRNVK